MSHCLSLLSFTLFINITITPPRHYHYHYAINITTSLHYRVIIHYSHGRLGGMFARSASAGSHHGHYRHTITLLPSLYTTSSLFITCIRQRQVTRHHTSSSLHCRWLTLAIYHTSSSSIRRQQQRALSLSLVIIITVINTTLPPLPRHY